MRTRKVRGDGGVIGVDLLPGEREREREIKGGGKGWLRCAQGEFSPTGHFLLRWGGYISR